MRRLVLVFTILLSGISLLAQNNYNRLLLHNNDSETKGFVIDKIDSLTFSTLEGNFIANFNIGEEVETYDFDNIDSAALHPADHRRHYRKCGCYHCYDHSWDISWTWESPLFFL